MTAVVPSEAEIKIAFKSSKSEKLIKFSQDSDIIKSVYDVFKATAEFVADNFGKDVPSIKNVTGFFMKKGVSIYMFYGKASDPDSKVVKMASAVHETGGAALDLVGGIRLLNSASASVSPAKAVTFVTASAAKKIVLAAGFGKVDKCKLAITGLLAETATTALFCTVSGPFCLLGIASVAVEAFTVYQQCEIHEKG